MIFLFPSCEATRRAKVGFLSDTLRTNVTLTRAKRALRIIGGSAMLGGNSFYAQLLDYFQEARFQEAEAYRTVWELEDTIF